jgi:uncharacterized membrane protein (UPF0127 family)
MLDKILTALILGFVSFATPTLAQEFHQAPLVIHAQTGDISFEVEVPHTDAQMQKGLMFRKDMPPKTGMLFIFNGRSHVSMWMKNTLISLDMLFINAQGKVVYIAKGTTPHSLDSIAPPYGVVANAVLELKAGTVNAEGIKVGDRVEHPAFNALLSR